MKNLICLALFANLAATQENCVDLFDRIPTCATPCLNFAAGAVGCATADFACQCISSHSTFISTAAQSCIAAACVVENIQLILDVSSELCTCIATTTPAATASFSRAVQFGEVAVPQAPTSISSSPIVTNTPASSSSIPKTESIKFTSSTPRNTIVTMTTILLRGTESPSSTTPAALHLVGKGNAVNNGVAIGVFLGLSTVAALFTAFCFLGKRSSKTQAVTTPSQDIGIAPDRENVYGLITKAEEPSVLGRLSNARAYRPKHADLRSELDGRGVTHLRSELEGSEVLQLE